MSLQISDAFYLICLIGFTKVLPKYDFFPTSERLARMFLWYRAVTELPQSGNLILNWRKNCIGHHHALHGNAATDLDIFPAELNQ